MIVKVLPPKPAGTGRPLNTYILAAKHERAGERLGPYIEDPSKDRVAWSRTVNSGVDNPLLAIGAIERYNAQNIRTHRLSRWVHVVVSFADGERPTREQADAIEDRLMGALDFGDHPRISAAHHDANHSHIHIAVSRINPTTFKAEHPWRSHFRLQAEAARLEIDLGLRRERKTVLSRERREIDFRARARDEPAFQGGDTMADDVELSKPQRFPLTGDREEAERITFPAIVNGRTIGDAQDLSAARYNDAKNSERSRDRDFVRVEGIDFITKGSTPEQRALFTQMEQNRQSEIFGQKPLSLYERYKAERENALVERKAAEQQIYEGFSDHQTQLRGFYEMRHEQVKLQLGRGIERHDSHELLKAQQRGDRVQAQAQRMQQLAKARASHPVPTWDSFLSREAERGNKEAERLLARRQERGRESSLER